MNRIPSQLLTWMLQFYTANGGTVEEKINSISILSSERERERCDTFLQLKINK